MDTATDSGWLVDAGQTFPDDVAPKVTREEVEEMLRSLDMVWSDLE